MPDRQTFVIIGANMAGGRAAQALRKEGFTGPIVLIGEEPDAPYERPPLSKEYLRGQVAKEKIYLAKEDFAAENDVDLRLGVRAERIDVAQRAVTLASGESVAYDKLLIATGGRPRRLTVPGADLDGVYYLRTFADSEAIAAELQEGKRAVVIGAGFIGAEVAASARMQGLDVTLLEIASVPLERALGADVGRIYAQLHRDHGVDLRLDEGIERIEGATRAERVVTTKGNSIDCDFVVAGVGIEPNVEIAEGTGIDVDNGIVVDEYCRTNVEDVFAAGDVANFYHPVLEQRFRVEHWENAQGQGRAAALNMLGRDEPYTDIPWFWSDQYDVNMQYAGHASSWDATAVRGDPEARDGTIFYLKDGRFLAVLAFNRFRDVRRARALLAAGVSPDPAQLADEDVDLQSLMPA
jgi:3-phenylpropionate/trans-cinnamate dioxygenase ferredoxin reductase subunit